MPVTINDYQLTLNGTQAATQDWSAVFYYQLITIGDPTAADLAGAFDINILPLMADFQNNAITYNSLSVINLADPDDFVESGVTTTQGTVVPTTSGHSEFWQSLGFRIVRATRRGRHGSKRLPGYDTGFFDAAGQVVDSGYEALLDAFATGLASPMAGSEGRVYALCIPRSELVTNPSPPPDEHYVIQELLRAADVVFVRATTQNSRKTW